MNNPKIVSQTGHTSSAHVARNKRGNLPPVAQRRSTPPALPAARPAAPPVYRPQPTPKVLQQKPAIVQTPPRRPATKKCSSAANSTRSATEVLQRKPAQALPRPGVIQRAASAHTPRRVIQLKKTSASELLKIFNQTTGFIFKKYNVAGVLERIRQEHNIGSSADYDVYEMSDWAQQAKHLGYENTKFESGKHGATRGGRETSTKSKAIVTVDTNFIKQRLEAGMVWDIVQVLRHEYEHVKQANSPSYPNRYRQDNAEREGLSEFMALAAEVKEGLRRLSRKGVSKYRQKGSLDLLVGAANLAMRSYAGKMSEMERQVQKDDIELVREVQQCGRDAQRLYQVAQKAFPTPTGGPPLSSASTFGSLASSVNNNNSTQSLATSVNNNNAFPVASMDRFEMIVEINDRAVRQQGAVERLAAMGISDQILLETLRDQQLAKILDILRRL